jgi:hypothetical protein
MRRARELTRLDSSALLPQFRDLLDAEDFDALFEGSTTDRQYWIHEMEAALAATAQPWLPQLFIKRHVNKNDGNYIPPAPVHAPLLLTSLLVTTHLSLTLLLTAALPSK